ncbi:MAG: glycogen synthase GlgA [Chloroflexi bacterium]|nr:glycogen synthase GlgA [Chloroflexota bacterium]
MPDDEVGQKNKLKILFMSAEVAPYAKTGGLADVAGALPGALHALGHDVRVVMPYYGRIDPGQFDLQPALAPFDVPLRQYHSQAALLRGMMGRVPIYFVEAPQYFQRENIYSYPDDAERFIFFARAALEMLPLLGWQPDIIHCNDWHTAIVPNWLKTLYAGSPFYKDMATVYTIHNLAYQGIFGYHVLEVAGIQQYGFINHPHTQDLNEVVDLMGRGILFADVISTVSPTYAREILTPEYGERLDPLLRDRQADLYGILNGIDRDVWNPATDPHLATNYTIDSLERRLENKLALQEEAQLPQDEKIPVVGIVGRMTDQKGFDILEQGIEHLLEYADFQFVLLGTGEQYYHDMFMRLANRFPGKTAIWLMFNATMAQHIYAGADIFLMPSRFEPCGLGQMLALRYGSIPVVRATGGLADTVANFDPATGEGWGFTFNSYSSWALHGGIVRAMEHFHNQATWRTLQERAMKLDFSWHKSARKYGELYHKAIDKHVEALS